MTMRSDGSPYDCTIEFCPPFGKLRSRAVRTWSTDNRLIELLDDHCAAGKLDASGDAFRRERDSSRDDDDPGERNRVPAPPEEIEVRVIEDMHG